MKICSIVAVGIAVVALAPGAASAKGQDRAALRSYLTHARAQLFGYREAVLPLDQLGDPAYPDEDVPGLFSGVAADISALAKPWAKIKAPDALHTEHAGRGRSLQLFSQALGILGDGWAQFLITQNPEDLQAARDLAAPLNAAVKRLELRWEKAVRAALRRAHLPEPHWFKLLGK